MYDMVWFKDENKAEAFALVRRLPDAEVAARELWDCHGLRFKLRIPIPDASGKLTDQVGTCIQPNLYGSESLSASLVETRDGGRYLCLARFCRFEVLPSGTVGATFENGLLETPEYLKAAKQHREDEAVRLGAVRTMREKLAQERLEATVPFTLRWARTVGIMAGVPDPDNLDAEDAMELFQVLKLGKRGLASLEDYITESGILPMPEAGKLSEDPLAEARDAQRRFERPTKITRSGVM